MKRISITFLVILMAFSMISCASAATTQPAETTEQTTQATTAAPTTTAAKESYKIGYIVAGPDDYYNVSAEVVKLTGAQKGWDVTVLNSEYTPELEISNVEDLIAKGVDGILVLAANMQSAQTATQKANEAGIPIVFVAGGPAEGAGVPDSIVAGNWAYSGEWHANNLNSVKPDAKVAIAAAVAGQDIGTLITDNFKNNFKGEIVSEQYCNWSRSEALAYVQDLIISGKEFDTIFALNEEMAAGAKQALEENGFKPGDVWIISNNGKPIGIEMIQQNWMQYTIQFAPTTEAYVAVLAMEALLSGKEVKPFIENPAISIGADNISDAITWDPIKFAAEDYKKLNQDELMAAILK